MSSLYNRASPSQARILRAVEGACKNATDAHPELQISPHHRRSIAKRAAGTLTAQWPEVLAAKPSESGSACRISHAPAPSSHLVSAKGRGASDFERRSPILILRSLITSNMTDIRRQGPPERYDAFVEVLRMIHAVENGAL